MPSFAHDPAVTARFPTLVGGIVRAVGSTNGPASSALVEAFEGEPVVARQRIGSTEILKAQAST